MVQVYSRLLVLLISNQYPYTFIKKLYLLYQVRGYLNSCWHLFYTYGKQIHFLNNRHLWSTKGFLNWTFLDTSTSVSKGGCFQRCYGIGYHQIPQCFPLFKQLCNSALQSFKMSFYNLTIKVFLSMHNKSFFFFPSGVATFFFFFQFLIGKVISQVWKDCTISLQNQIGRSD